MMKHPHTLFSTYKRPDNNGRINDVNRRQIHIQPNIILPSTMNHPNHLKYQNNMLLNKKMQMMSGKPRVEQKHSSMPPHPQPLPIPSNTYPANSLYNISIPTTNNQSKFYSENKHLFSCIQKQMADCQIPMCLVQDEKGKLHQLVYTLPEKVYKQYVNSLGEKQNVQCQSTKTKEDTEVRQSPKKHFKSNDRIDQDTKSNSATTMSQAATTINNVSPNVNTYKDNNQMIDVKCTKELKCLYKGENISSKESLIERLANVSNPARDVVNKNNKEKKLQKDNRNIKRKIVTAKCNEKNHKTNVPNASRHVEKPFHLKKNEKNSLILDTQTNNKFENDSIRTNTDNSTADIGELKISNDPHELICDNMSNFSNNADGSNDKIKHVEISLFSDPRKRKFDSRNDSMLEKYFKTMTNEQVDLSDQYPSPTPTDNGSIETTNETDQFEIFSFNGDLPSIGSNSTSSFESSNDSPINSVSLNSVASTDTDYSMGDDNLTLFETTELKDLFHDFNPAHAGYIDNVFENISNGFESNYFDLTQDLYADEPLDFRIFEQNSLLTNENCN